MFRYAAFLLAGMLLAGVGCESNPGSRSQPDDKRVTGEDVKRANREAVETNRKYAEQKMEEYRKDMQRKLDEMNQQLERWNAKIEQATGEMKQKLIEQKAAFEKKRDAFVEQMKKLSDASGEAWKDIKVGLDRAYEDLSDSFNKARQHFQ
jgi:TolA-binding protein